MSDDQTQPVDNQHTLHLLENAIVLLENASKTDSTETISAAFPTRLSGLTQSITSLQNRDDAERLLSIGVSMWNTVIALEGKELDKTTLQILVRVRHVAADCMYKSYSVLGGVSDRYSIDQFTLFRFYTACGHKYAKQAGELDLAELCFSKAAEFVEEVLNEDGLEENDQTAVARAMFDLLLGQAECAWEKEETDKAEQFVSSARKYLKDLPGQHEFLASIEYNFGLYTYQLKNVERALRWLRRSLDTRGSEHNPSMNLAKQAITMRLAGVCLLTLKQYDESWQLMHDAENLHHEPSGAYLMLKLSIITNKPQATNILTRTIGEKNVSLEVCLASVALFEDANRTLDAIVGYQYLFERFSGDARAIVCSIGPRYFQALVFLGRVAESLGILDTCCSLIPQLASMSKMNTDQSIERSGVATVVESSQFSQWAAMLLCAGCEHADRDDRESAAILLHRALKVARMCASKQLCENEGPHTNAVDETKSPVLKNEGLICRFLSSCALLCIDNAFKSLDMNLDNPNQKSGIEKKSKERHGRMLELAKEHAQRAKELDPSDCRPRLLLFRTHLIAGDFKTAAEVLKKGSEEIRSFDAGSLAEAACAAQNAGSTESVIAVLLCILKTDLSILTKNISRSSSAIPPGFYGAVFISCIRFMLKQRDEKQTDENIEADNIDPKTDNDEVIARKELLNVLQIGLSGLKAIGTELAFGVNENERREKHLSYLADIAWNEGRKAGTVLDYEAWEGFYDACNSFSQLATSTKDRVEMRRTCRLMCACANVEKPNASEKEFKKVKDYIAQAREKINLLRNMKAMEDDDPTGSWLLLLEARCNVGCGDMNGLENVVAEALQSDLNGDVLEQLASICHSWQTHMTSVPDVKLQCIELQISLLAQAVDKRLGEEQVDEAALAITMREHIGMELSRSTSGGAFAAFRKAVDVVVERTIRFPKIERRWLIAVGWDKANMLIHIGRRLEAKAWASWTNRLIVGNVQLSPYASLIQAMLQKLNDVSDVCN